MTKREAIFPANRHALYEAHGYSAAIRSGDLVFVSGQVGSRNDGTPEPDFGKQVQLAFENLEATLKAAGCTFDDIIDVTTFHTDPETSSKPSCRSRTRFSAIHLFPTGQRLASTGLPVSTLKSRSSHAQQAISEPLRRNGRSRSGRSPCALNYNLICNSNYFMP